MYKFDEYEVKNVFDVLKVLNSAFHFSSWEEFMRWLDFETEIQANRWNGRNSYWGTLGFYATTYDYPSGGKGIKVTLDSFTVKMYMDRLTRV